MTKFASCDAIKSRVQTYLRSRRRSRGIFIKIHTDSVKENLKYFNYIFQFFPVSAIYSLLCYDFSANTTLEEYFKSNRITFNLDSLITVAVDLISAIQHLEQKGVVHNNITTSSILIGRGFRVSLKH